MSSMNIDKTINNLGIANKFNPDDKVIIVAFVLREKDIRPLDAPWWTGKQCSIIAGDIDGNFFLRHSDGSVRYWVHRSQSETTVARSVKDFLKSITL